MNTRAHQSQPPTRHKPLNGNAPCHASGAVKTAATFLAWLVEEDLDLPSCRQKHLDRWHAGTPDYQRRQLRPFLQWATRSQLMAPLRLPRSQTRQRPPLTGHRRLALIRRLLDDDALPRRPRVAALLMLLYAQPLARIAALRPEDIVEADGQTLLRIGEPPAPLPQPLDHLLLALRDARPAASPWLFPGHSDRHLNSRYLGQLVRHAGIPTVPGRTAALHQLVLQAPAPVVADMLGYHPKHLARVVADTGITWNRYTADIAHEP